MVFKKKNLNFSWRLSSFVFAVIAIFSGLIAYTSYTYNLSLGNVAKNYARYITLTAVSLGSNVYDVSKASTINPELGPLKIDPSNHSFPRIEEYCYDDKISGIKLIEAHNEQIVLSHFNFAYQSDVPRLREMREEMKLDEVVAGAADEFEKMIRLRQWVRQQFSRSDYQKQMEQFDALSIWKNPQKNNEKRAAKIGAEYMPCHFFPLFYSQVILSMGFTSRVVHISTTGYDYHGFTEVWSNQFGKWISMDPDLNLCYEAEGIPQNMLEVHNARYASDSPLEVLQIIVEPGNQPKETAENMINYHRYIEVADLRNDWLTNKYFRGHPKRSDLATLAWKDDREPEIFRLTPATRNVEDIYWTLNQAEILVEPEKCGQDSMALFFNTVTPNFSYFAIHINGKAFEQTSPAFVWKLQNGRNELIVYPVNSFGVHGISSRIVLQYESE